MGRKLGVVPFLEGGAGPHLTQCRLGRGVPPYQVSFWSIQLFGHNRHGPKIGELRPLFGEEGAGSKSNTVAWAEAYHHTKWHLNPSRHLGATDVGQNWGAVPLWGRGSWVPSPHLTQCGQGWDLPARQVSSWSIQPFGHSTPTLQIDRTDRQIWQTTVW